MNILYNISGDFVVSFNVNVEAEDEDEAKKIIEEMSIDQLLKFSSGSGSTHITEVTPNEM